MTEAEQLKVALSICQAQRNRAADETIEAQIAVAGERSRNAELQTQLDAAQAALTALKEPANGGTNG